MTTTASEFADLLRDLASFYDAEPALPVPWRRLRITADASHAREAYFAVRRMFPNAEVTTDDDVWIDVDATDTLRFSFWKASVGIQQTVTREVIEYVLPGPLPAAS